jgi:hypothetical protein
MDARCEGGMPALTLKPGSRVRTAYPTRSALGPGHGRQG